MSVRTFKVPPQAPPVFTTSPDSILDDARRLIEQSRKTQTLITEAISPSTATFANTLLVLAQDGDRRRREAHVLEFYQHVSDDGDLRAASRCAEDLLKDFSVETAMREDVFRLLEAVPTKNEELDQQSRHYLEKEVKSYVRNGLGLSPGQERDRFKEIQKRLGQISVEFRKNLNNEKGGLWFSENELNGLSKDDLSRLELGEGERTGQLRVSFKFPEVSSVLQHARNSNTRRQLLIANSNKVPENVPLLREALLLRDEAARLLGYSNHAEFRLEEKMIKSPQTINSFLKNLKERLKPRAFAEVEKLKELKRKDMATRGEPFDGHYYMWDDKFYQRLMLKTEFSFDVQKVAEYFPLNTTIKLMLDTFEKLFGMEFIEIAGKDRDQLSNTGVGDHLVWHPDVQMFSAWNASNDEEFLGYLYFDLHPRDGKFGGAANFNLRPGFVDSDGLRSYPATALVCNFSKPTSKKPTLLKHEEVVVLFHELGHGIHDLVSRTKFAKYHGTMCVVDFCEAPSQLLENWCWSPETLKSLSRHYSTLSPEYFQVWMKEQAQTNSDVASPPDKISDDMIESLVRTKNVNSSIFTLVTLHAAIFDMTVHQLESSEAGLNLNTSKIWNKMRSDIMPIDGPDSQGEGDEWGHHEVTFGQLLGDYDAGIYGYLCSQMYSSDIFESFFKSNPMNPTEGLRYRRMVLEHGGSRDEMKMLEEYLGRKPNPEAFYRELGLV